MRTAMPSLLLLTFVMSGATPAAAQTAPAPAPSAAVAAAPAPAVDVPADYVIGPEDVLGVVFWRENELSGDVTVRPDGRITLPVLGELAAAGKRPADLKKEIATLATKYITDPNVTVMIRAINSRKAYVTGRVTHPGAFDLRGPVTVMQALAMAGGLTEYADARGITILRKVEGREDAVFHFNYRDVAKGRNLTQNIVLKPGDTVVVP